MQEIERRRRRHVGRVLLFGRYLAVVICTAHPSAAAEPPSPRSLWSLEVAERDSSEPMSKAGVLIVADVRLYREGLAGSLSTFSGLVVVGTCATCADAHDD